MKTVQDTIGLKYMSAIDVFNTLKAAIEKYGKDNISFDVDVEYDYGDNSAAAYLRCTRPMTPLELEEHENLRKRSEAAALAAAKAHYEQLKKRFKNT